jgi:HicB family
MAKVPPPKKPKSTKGAPPPTVSTAGNLDKPEPVALVPLNFRVPSEFRKEFKIYAAQQGVPMNELVQKAFVALKDKNAR